MTIATTHLATFYRRSGSATRDSHGGRTKAWQPTASDIPVTFQPATGSVEGGAPGRDVEIAAKLFVEPGELPDGVDVLPDDGVVLQGRTSRSTYIVGHARLQEDRGAGWDDEILLEDTEEAIP